MADTTYRAGAWLGLVRSSSVIVLEAQTDPATVDALWEYLGREAPTIHGVLNAVTSHFGPELTGMPQFGILVRTGRLHVILRGGMSLAVNIDGATDTVSGRDVTTWSERSLALPGSLVLTLDPETPAEEGSPVLPVEEAVVLLSEFSQGVPGLAGAVSSGAVSGGAVSSGTISSGTDSGTAGALVESSDAVDSPSAAAGEVSVFKGGPSDESGTDSVSSAGPKPSIESEPSKDTRSGIIAGDGPSIDPGSGIIAGDGPVGSATEPQQAGTGPSGVADDEDDYACFALAADAEWSAELAESSAAEPDFGAAEEDWHRPAAAEPGLGQDLYPQLAHPDDQSGPAASGATDSQDAAGYAEEADVAKGAAGVGWGGVTVDGGSGPGERGSGAEPADDTTNHDHGFGATERRSVEDAAGHVDENGHELAKVSAAPVVSNIPPQPLRPPAVGQRPDARNGDSQLEEGAATAVEGSSAPAGVPAGAPADVPAWQPPSGLPMSSLPRVNSDTVQLPGRQEWAAATDHVEAGEPDHGAHMVMRSAPAPDLAGGGAAALPAAAPPEPRPSTGPLVLARLCPVGHANPPSRLQCSDCGANIDSEPREVGRPRLGRMHVSTGEVLDLDHSLIIGRQPSVSQVRGGVVPRLVQVHSGSGDISRSHVEVRLEGWDVLLVDLKATNGTVLVREGQAPWRLAQGEQAILRNGDVAELGDGVSLLFEGFL